MFGMALPWWASHMRTIAVTRTVSAVVVEQPLSRKPLFLVVRSAHGDVIAEHRFPTSRVVAGPREPYERRDSFQPAWAASDHLVVPQTFRRSIHSSEVMNISTSVAMSPARPSLCKYWFSALAFQQ
jgi:hypothetical protein